MSSAGQEFALTGVMPEGGPPEPSCGGDGADSALAAVLEMIGGLHMQLAGVIDEHSSKLKTAHDKYQSSEESLTQLIEQIKTPDTIS